jgi:hypothetical protein
MSRWAIPSQARLLVAVESCRDHEKGSLMADDRLSIDRDQVAVSTDNAAVAALCELPAVGILVFDRKPNAWRLTAKGDEVRRAIQAQGGG